MEPTISRTSAPEQRKKNGSFQPAARPARFPPAGRRPSRSTRPRLLIKRKPPLWAVLFFEMGSRLSFADVLSAHFSPRSRAGARPARFSSRRSAPFHDRLAPSPYQNENRPCGAVLFFGDGGSRTPVLKRDAGASTGLAMRVDCRDPVAAPQASAPYPG